MNAQQFEIFLKYWGMGRDRSLVKLREQIRHDYTTATPKKKVPSIDTFKLWSMKFDWQRQIIEMDEEANKQVLLEAMGAAREARTDILKIFKAVVMKFAVQMKDQNRETTAMDVYSFWKMARIEMNLPSDRPDLTSGNKPFGGDKNVSPEEDNRIFDLFTPKDWPVEPVKKEKVITQENAKSETNKENGADNTGGVDVPEEQQSGSAYEGGK